MRLPDFIIIGAAKSGTTTLYQYLCRHPKIYMSTPKEPDFFSIDENYNKGIEWYRSLFSEASTDTICGEASTTYSRLHQHPKAVERIAQTLPKVKLIYILRHPIDRAYSFYVYRLKNSSFNTKYKVEKTFEETIKTESEYIDSSLYFYQIEKYLQFYPKESFLFLLMEDLIQKPEQTMKEIINFLGIEEIDLTQEGLIASNKVSDYPEWYVKKELLKSVKKIPGISQITKLIPNWTRELAYQGVRKLKYQDWAEEQKTYLPPPMLPETRKMLIDKFGEPNQKLGDFLNRDLSHWNQ